jgi:hypothetical protein
MREDARPLIYSALASRRAAQLELRPSPPLGERDLRECAVTFLSSLSPVAWERAG